MLTPTHSAFSSIATGRPGKSKAQQTAHEEHRRPGQSRVPVWPSGPLENRPPRTKPPPPVLWAGLLLGIMAVEKGGRGRKQRAATSHSLKTKHSKNWYRKKITKTTPLLSAFSLQLSLSLSIQHSALLLQGDPVKARHNTQLTKSIAGQASHVRLFGPAGRWKNSPPTTKPTPTPIYFGPFSPGMVLREKGRGWGRSTPSSHQAVGTSSSPLPICAITVLFGALPLLLSHGCLCVWFVRLLWRFFWGIAIR